MLHPTATSAPMIGSARLQWYCCSDCNAHARTDRLIAKRATKRAERQRTKAAIKTMTHDR